MANRNAVLFWVVLAGAACLLSLSSARVPLLDPDEARFARTSVEMIRSGDPVVPQFEGRPRLVKPPLMHWVQSSLFRVFGSEAWVARLHSTLATLVTLLLTGWVAARRWGDEAGIWVAAVLCSMPLVVAAGFLGTIDALLAAHVFAVVALDMTRPPEGRRHESWIVGALLGLAFLTKGPVGVLLPLLVLLAGRTASGRLPVATARGVGRALLAGAAVVLPWGLAFLGRVSGPTVADTVRGEVLERYFAGTSHVEPAWFYLQVLVAGCLPWCVPLAAGCWRAVRERAEPASRTALYAAAGLLAGLIFFSLGKGKLPTYILPLMPLAALVVTWELGRQIEEAPRGRSKVGFALAAANGLLAAGFTAASQLRPEPFVRVVAGSGALLFAAGAVVAFRSTWSRRPRGAWGGTALATAGFIAVAMLVLLPELSRTRTSAWLVRDLPELREGRPVAVVDLKLPSLTFYLDRVPEQIDMSNLVERLQAPGDIVLVFDEDDLAAAPPEALASLSEIGRQGKYVVFERR